MVTRGTTQTIFFLASNDEVRALYENALKSQTTNIVWFNSFESLSKSNITAIPRAIIIDLDTVNHPIDWAIQQIRTQYRSADLIALSSSDSAQTALQSIRSGCADFLLKPTSPEELSWSLRRLEARNHSISRITSTEGESIQAVNQISSATSHLLVQLHAAEYLQQLLSGASAAWVQMNGTESRKTSVTCAVPREANVASILFDFPQSRGIRDQFLLKNRRTGARRAFFPTLNFGGVFVSGIRQRPSAKCLETARLIIAHSELCLANLQKLEEIKAQTFVDDLTGLFNSRYLKFSLSSAITRCKDPKQAFSVLFIDVDHFKRINDTHGHLVGSDFLIAVSRALKHAVRNIDLVFRYGGDEFVILLHQTGVTGAKDIAERVRKHIERRVFNIRGVKIQATITIGLATYPTHAHDKDELLRLADEAMYSAKRMTRNAVHLAGQ